MPETMRERFDGTGHHSSRSVKCKNCCVKNHRDGTRTGHHHMLGAAIVHPDLKEVLPLAPEPIPGKTATPKTIASGTRRSVRLEIREAVIPANFSFSQTMPFSMKKLIFNDFFCRTGIKIPAKPDKKSTKKIFKKPRKPLNNLMKKISGNCCPRREHPHMQAIIVEDGLASNGPHAGTLMENDFWYILRAKPGDHKLLFGRFEASETRETWVRRDMKTGALQRFEWDSNLPPDDGHFDLKVNMPELVETRGTSKQGIGRSRGGLTSRTVAVTDALGYLVRFVLLPGQARDLSGMPDLLEGLEFGALVGDRALDADWLVEEVERRGAMAVIPSKRNRKVPRDHDGEMYKWRHQVGNFLAKTGEFRAIATRRDKTDVSYAAAIHLAAGVIAAK